MSRPKYFLWLTICLSLTACYFPEAILNVYLFEGSVKAPIVSNDDHLYVAKRSGALINSQLHLLQEVDLQTGIAVTVAGTSTATVTDGTGTSASFKDILDLLVSPTDPSILYVADECTVRTVNTTTWQVTRIAGMMANCSKTEGSGNTARFANVTALAHDGSSLYIGTSYYIMQMNLMNTNIVTYAGEASSGAYVDGTRLTARFNGITGFALVDQDLFILDSLNFRIRKLNTLTGEVTTFAGNGSRGSQDGIGTSASFNFNELNKISYDGENFLYVTDNSAIRKISISTGEVTTVVSPKDHEDSDGAIEQTSTFYPSGISYSTKGLFFANEYGVRRLR